MSSAGLVEFLVTAALIMIASSRGGASQSQLVDKLHWRSIVDVDAFAASTEGYSPADIECVCRRAVINASARSRSVAATVSVDAAVSVTGADVTDALNAVTPVTTREDLAELENWTM